MPYASDVATAILDMHEATSIRLEKASLELIYPNPFNSETVIPFTMADAGDVDVGVYDLRGTQVKRLAQGLFPVGRHVVKWDGTDADGRQMASGVYVIRLAVRSSDTTRKVVLLR